MSNSQVGISSNQNEKSKNENDALRRMAKLVNNFISKTDSAPFREPVDWRGLGIFDYPKVIKKMMDLGTVKRKLLSQEYETAQESANDVRLIWKNCMTYNADGSDFFILAEIFSKKFEERYKKIKIDCDVQDDSSNTNNKGGSSGEEKIASAPTLESRVKFASDLFRLNGVELGHVMQVIDLRCPHALEKPATGSIVKQPLDHEIANNSNSNNNGNAEDELEVNVDAIDTRTFTELETFVSEHIQRRLASAGSSDTKKIGKRKQR